MSINTGQYLVGRRESVFERRHAVLEDQAEAIIVGHHDGDPLPAPPFKVTGLDGADYELSAYKGRKVLLNFWATWCPPCRAELQDFRENSEAFREAGVELLTISVDEPAEREKVRKFVDELRLPFPVLLANDPVVAAYSVLNRLLFV